MATSQTASAANAAARFASAGPWRPYSGRPGPSRWRRRCGPCRRRSTWLESTAVGALAGEVYGGADRHRPGEVDGGGRRPVRSGVTALGMAGGEHRPGGARRATTVTSGGSSTDSSPGDTSVIASRYSATGPGPAQAGASAQASTSSRPASTARAGSRAPDVGVAGVGHRQRAPADASGAGDRLLGDDPAARANCARIRRKTRRANARAGARSGRRRGRAAPAGSAPRPPGSGPPPGPGPPPPPPPPPRRGGRVQVDRVDPAVAADHGPGRPSRHRRRHRRRRTSNPRAGRAGRGR